ncbi:hypothetical protein [Jeongeupia naejangsanensis]|uniref:Uncharacterized protein n=1 Tax=Jeongeupia naejangsanensis TaxID=613195 RepID=A0ABS2BGQ0_9NEIS|nr:hypothetical protein [Jeongeupia naejangsanensis]MBM3114783.1 hypothetical protein [Jeongeupia naejangsanensis]
MMSNTTGETYGFLSQMFQLYLMVIDRLLQTPELSAELRYTLILVYSCVFVIMLSLLFLFAKFLLSLIAKGISALFLYLTASLDNPRSLPYVSTLAFVQSIPWYFSLLVLILGFCGLAALITGNPVWSESFKYIMGATVGSLIGVVQKKEQVEIESRLYGLLERETKQSLGVESGRIPKPADDIGA